MNSEHSGVYGIEFATACEARGIDRWSMLDILVNKYLEENPVTDEEKERSRREREAMDMEAKLNAIRDFEKDPVMLDLITALRCIPGVLRCRKYVFRKKRFWNCRKYAPADLRAKNFSKR